MSLIRWSPFFDQFEEFSKQSFIPAVDVYETKDTVMVEAPLAGVEPEQVDIHIENNILTIKGETEKKQEVEEKDYYRKEVRHGSFYRQIALPSAVDGEKAEATFENGILKIRIPKRLEEATKSIKVTVKK